MARLKLGCGWGKVARTLFPLGVLAGFISEVCMVVSWFHSGESKIKVVITQ